MPDMKECFKTHSVLHWIFGVGLGLVLAGLIFGLSGGSGMVIGIILLVVGFGGEFVFLPKKGGSQTNQ